MENLNAKVFLLTIKEKEKKLQKCGQKHTSKKRETMKSENSLNRLICKTIF